MSSGVSASFGTRCARCGMSAGILLSAGLGKPTCPCGGELVPDSRIDNVSNFRCQCGFSAGHMVSSGPATCRKFFCLSRAAAPVATCI